MRVLPVALLLLALALGSCGDPELPALRIDLETFSFDGDLPDGLRVRRLELDGTEGRAYALRPVAGGHRGEYEVPGAPDGPYRVEGPSGWWMLRAESAPPRLVRGLQPPQVELGRGRALYLGAQDAGVRPSDVWGAVRIGPEGVEEPVPVTVEVDDRGYVVAVRFAPEAWRGTLQVIGRVAHGPPPTPSPAADAPLAQPIQFEATADGHPLVMRLRPSDMSGLQVVLVAASEEVDTSGLLVRASYEGLPIPSAFEAYGRGGLAQFAGVPVVDRLLHLKVGDEPGGHRLDPMVRRRQANLRVLVTGDLPLIRVRVLAGPDEVDLVLVRPRGAAAYGRVPFERVEGGVAFAAPRGAFGIYLRSGTRWASAQADSNEDLDLHLSEGSFLEGVIVGGNVDSVRPGAVVRFFRSVGGTTDEAVLGDGFEVCVEPVGAFEAHLPTGRYLVEVATQTGVWRRPAALIAESPGARLHVPLESP